MPEPLFLTTEALACKYPPHDGDSMNGWYEVLKRWRDMGKLRPAVDWKYARDEDTNRRCRVYAEMRVLKLVWNAESGFPEAVKIEHLHAIQRIVTNTPIAEVPQISQPKPR